MQDEKRKGLKAFKAPVDLDAARRRLTIGVLICALAGLALFVVFRPLRHAETLLNVSYDATREFYGDVNEAFLRRNEESRNRTAKIQISHAGSSAQVQALVRGLMADVVTLATAADLDAVSRAGLISADWRQRLPHGSSPYSSTIVFLVRGGNPKQVKDWEDLAREDVATLSPDPQVSGAGRWGYLAAWGAVLRQSGDAGEAEKMVWRIYWKAELVSDGARGVLERFERTQEGDVLLTWESEAHYAVQRYGSDRFQVIYPSTSIMAEPVVAVVDRYVDRRGTRANAEAYLEFLFSRDGQAIAGKHFFRPRTIDANALPKIPLFTVEEFFGSWDEAVERHFADGGTFDRIAQLRRLKRAE